MVEIDERIFSNFNQILLYLTEGEMNSASDLLNETESLLENKSHWDELIANSRKFIQQYQEGVVFLQAIANGDLTVSPPDDPLHRNFVISQYKQLHSNLSHMTWQIQQIARGDLKQKVSFLGEFTDAFTIMTDALKEKKLMEEKIKLQNRQLQKLNETLEERVTQRTIELERINKNLEFHIHEIEQFSYIATHDLQEPLRTLTNFTQLIREEYSGKLTSDGNKYIEFISSSAERMRVLVNGLLDYSLIGKSNGITVIDCNETVREVLSGLSDSIKKSKARITAQELPKINGYSTELRLLFQNLIDNAIKFRGDDVFPEISISYENREKDWVFKITDNGIGIKEKDKVKIFSIFKRMQNRNEFEGTGIGLAHCKKIVELHGGKIWVESKKGTGSAFLFSIPKRPLSNV